jgi:hypothetical protein
MDGDDPLSDDEETDKKTEASGMVETQMVRLVVRIFPVVHKSFKGMGRVISLIGLPGVNVAKCLQRVCDPRFYDIRHGDIGRSREALWRELVHAEFGVMEEEMRHDDMEGRLCDFDNYDDHNHHIFHFCSEVLPQLDLRNPSLRDGSRLRNRLRTPTRLFRGTTPCHTITTVIQKDCKCNKLTT